MERDKKSASGRMSNASKKAIRTRIANDLSRHGESTLSTPSEDSPLSSPSSPNVENVSLSDVARRLTRIINYDFVKNLESAELFSFERIVQLLVEWLNANKLPFSRVKEFFEEKPGKSKRLDGTKAIRLFVSAYWEKYSVRDTLIKTKFPGYVDGRKNKKAAASTIDASELTKYRKNLEYMKDYIFPNLIQKSFHNDEAMPILASLIVATYINSHEIDNANVPWETLERVIGAKYVQMAREHGSQRISNNERNVVALHLVGLPPAPSNDGIGLELAHTGTVGVTGDVKTSNAIEQCESKAKAYMQAKADAERADEFRNRALDKVQMAKEDLKLNVEKLRVYKVDQQSRDALRKVTGCGGKRCELYSDLMTLVSAHLLDDDKDDEFFSSFLEMRKRLIDINNEDANTNYIPSENNYENAEEEIVVEISDEDNPTELEKKSEAENESKKHSKKRSKRSRSKTPSSSSSKKKSKADNSALMIQLFGPDPVDVANPILPGLNPVSQRGSPVGVPATPGKSIQALAKHVAKVKSGKNVVSKANTNAVAVVQENVSVVVPEKSQTVVQENVSVVVPEKSHTVVQENVSVVVPEKSQTVVQKNVASVVQDNATAVQDDIAPAVADTNVTANVNPAIVHNVDSFNHLLDGTEELDYDWEDDLDDLLAELSPRTYDRKKNRDEEQKRRRSYTNNDIDMNDDATNVLQVLPNYGIGNREESAPVILPAVVPRANVQGQLQLSESDDE